MVNILSSSNKINSRELAVYTLIDIQQQKLYNNLSLKKLFYDNKELSSQEKAFITELVNGTLRNIVFIDFIINAYSKTKTTSPKMKPLILNILRISVYQVRFMPKIPHSAICNEAVNFAKKKNFNGLAGFINGVLRSIIRNIDDISMILPDPKVKPVEFLCTRYSYSDWIIKKWLKELSFQEVEAICKANTLSPKVSICVNTNKITVGELKELLIKEGMSVSNGSISENALYIGKTKNIAQSTSFKKGYFHVMDESSMLAVEVLNNRKIDKIDKIDKNLTENIIDLCASPGGKSFYTSYLVSKESKISSRDIHEHKIDLMQKTINRLDIKNISIELKDASVCYEEDIETADKVLIDAPCSGLGIVKKKPDIKLNREEADISKLVELQRKILENSSKYVKSDGVLVYSTCTLFKEENIENINWFCDNFNFRLDPITNLSEYFLSALKDNLDEESYNKFLENLDKGYINIYPHLFNTDGFFIARLKKIK